MNKFLFTISLFFFVFISHAQVTFQKIYNRANFERANFIRQTSDGGYIITARTSGFGGYDIFLIKTDTNGDSLWTKIFGGTSSDEGNSVQQTTDGGYIIAGATGSFGAGGKDVYLIKTDINGDTIWTKSFGGTNDDEGASVQQTTDGGYIIAGNTFSFGAGIENVYLIKTDSNGDTLWTKTYGGIYQDGGKSVHQTLDGGYIITGRTYSFGAGQTDFYLIKTDVNGNSVWTKAYGGSNYDEVNSVQQTSDGGYVLIGYTESFGSGSADVYLIKTDANGNSLWTKTYGGTGYDAGSSIQQTTDGGYIITGQTRSLGLTDYDVYLIKTNSNGDALWSKTFGGLYDDWGVSVQQTSDTGYIIAGLTTSFGTFMENIYLVKTDSTGNSGCNEATVATIVTTAATQIINPSTVVISPATIVTSPATIVGSGGTDSTLCIGVGINEPTADNLFFIFPNPSPGNFEIKFSEIIKKGEIEIYNVLGEKDFEESILNESKKEINIKNISQGIYIVKVFDGENSYCKKLIVE